MFSDQCTYNLIGKINDFQSLIVGSSPAMCTIERYFVFYFKELLV